MGGWGVTFLFFLALNFDGKFWYLSCYSLYLLLAKASLGELFVESVFGVMELFSVLLMVATGMYTCVTFHRTVHPLPPESKFYCMVI